MHHRHILRTAITWLLVRWDQVAVLSTASLSVFLECV
jgi:hypothetical protein